MTDATQATDTGQLAPVPTPGGERGAGVSGRHLRASLIMASGSTVSRILGFGRNFIMGMIVAGTGSAVSTAVSAANLLPNSIWIFIGGGVLNAILVPAIVRAIERPDRGSDYISRLMTLVMTAAALLTVVSIALVPVLVTVTSGRLQGPTLALAIQLGFWLMPQIMFSALYVLCGQLLNAHESFGPYEWATGFNNIVGILGGLAFLAIWGQVRDPTEWTLGMIIAFAAFNVGGSAAQVFFLFFFVRRLGLKLRPRWGFRGLGLGKLSKIGLWTLAMLGVAQLGIWATRWSTGAAQRAAAHFSAIGDTVQADRFPSLYALDSSYMVFMIPQGIIAVAVVSSAFPTIARHASAGDHGGVLLQYVHVSRVLLVPMILATVLFIGLAAPIMYVIVGGAGRTAAQANGMVLTGYMLGLVPFAANYLVKRVFYAYEDARGPFFMQLPNALVSILMIWPILQFVDPLWATAVAAAVSSGGNLLGWLLGLWLLDRKMSAHGIRMRTARGSGIVLAKLSLAGVVSLAVGAVIILLLGDVLLSNRGVTVLLGVVVGAVMSAVFLGLAWLLRVQELRSLVGLLMGRLRRRRGTPPSAPAPAATTAPTGGGPGSAAAPFRSMVATPATAPTPTEGSGVNPRPHDDELAARWQLDGEIPLAGLAVGASWHRARSIATGEPLALLIVRGAAAAETADAARRTFLVEDPHLLPIEDVTQFGADGEDPVTVVSYPMPTSPPLAALLGDGTIRPETARSVIGEAATGLEAARRRGVRHEHLDSNRIFVDARVGAVTVLGVGVEAATFGEDSTPGTIAAYTDVTALAALLYRAVSGHSARRGPDGNVPLPSRVTDRPIPAEIDALCDAVLNGSSQDAPANARQLIDWIGPWQSIPVTLEAYDPADASGPVATPGAPVDIPGDPGTPGTPGESVDAHAAAGPATAGTAADQASPSGAAPAPGGTEDPRGEGASDAPRDPQGEETAASQSAGASTPSTAGAASTVAAAGAAGDLASATIGRDAAAASTAAAASGSSAAGGSETGRTHPEEVADAGAQHPDPSHADGSEGDRSDADGSDASAGHPAAPTSPAPAPSAPTGEAPTHDAHGSAQSPQDAGADAEDLVRELHLADKRTAAAFPAALPWGPDAPHDPAPTTAAQTPPAPTAPPAGRSAGDPGRREDDLVSTATSHAAEHPGSPAPRPSETDGRSASGTADRADQSFVPPEEDTVPVTVRGSGGERPGGAPGPIVVPGRASSVRVGEAAQPEGDHRASLFRDVVSVALDDERPATYDLGPEPGPARSRQTQWILIGAILIVIVALVFAITSITSGLRETFSNPLGTTSPAASESAAPASAAPPAEGAPSEAAPAEAPPAPPAIAGVDISGNDHPDNALRLTDGDPGTVWKSKQYRSATFGNLHDGIGLTVRLAAPATVTDVVVTAGDVTGGKLQLRTLNEDGGPGDVVAEGTFHGPGEIHLTPGQPLQNVGGVVVWIAELPQNGGKNVAEISEIRVA